MARQNFGAFNGGNMQQMLRQAQKMQQQMLEAQEKLEATEYEGTAGGGSVTVKVTGKHQIVDLTIKPDCVDPEDVEMLQDLVKAAVNDAMNKADENRESTMNKMAPGMGGMF